MWGMNIDIEDGNGISCDPLSWEIRPSPDYQRAFLCFQTRTSMALRKKSRGEHLSTLPGVKVF